MIGQLGDDSFQAREKASSRLVEIGKAAVPALQQSRTDPDSEIVRRAEHCLHQINCGATAPLSSAVVRLVGSRKPAGAVGVLLGYLPSVENAGVADEIRASLTALALQNGKPDPELVQALMDKLPVRRACAAEALTAAGATEQVPAVCKLLKDADNSVRLRVALALIAARDKEAVPTLIDLLTEVPLDQACQAEECLCHLASDSGPPVVLGNDKADRQKCRDAWAGWWRVQGNKLDLAGVATRGQLGYTLIVGSDRISEVDRNGQERWHLKGLARGNDAQLLPGDRILVAEYCGCRVSERTLTNVIIWEKRIDLPFSAQRLANGNTFIVTPSQLLELDLAQNIVFKHKRSGITAARRLRDGQIVCATSNSLVWLDASGEEIKSLPIGGTARNGLDVLSNGRVLVAQHNDNRVVEIDGEGKIVWEAVVQKPWTAVRLSNGNTLVASQDEKQVIELNRAGKTVWEYRTTNLHPCSARRR